LEDVPNPTDEVQLSEPVMVTDDHVEPQPQRSIRARRTIVRYNLLIAGQRDILLLDNEEPNTYTEAMMGMEYEKWVDAM
jgi:hypothetical protein